MKINNLLHHLKDLLLFLKLTFVKVKKPSMSQMKNLQCLRQKTVDILDEETFEVLDAFV